jgi:peptide/nickel transport system permease protein
MSLVYVTLATSVPGAIVSEAALSWLGFVDYWRMSWGRMLAEMQGAGAVGLWWWVVPPGLCIAGISIAFVLLGYALDEVLNPKLRMRK